MTFKSALASSEMPNPALLRVDQCQSFAKQRFDASRNASTASALEPSEVACKAQLDAFKV